MAKAANRDLENNPQDPEANDLDMQEVLKLFKGLANIGRTSLEDRSQIVKDKINQGLTNAQNQLITAIFPPCADVLLARSPIEETSGMTTINGNTGVEEITVARIFREYFAFRQHTILPGAKPEDLKKELPEALLLCQGSITPPVGTAPASAVLRQWPTGACLSAGCVTLEGDRHIYQLPDMESSEKKIKRLYIGDLLWLFYIERMGVFQIIGKILDEYAYNGGIPMSNGIVHPEQIKDDIVTVILESMVRQMEAGNSSKTRDRDSSYRRCLGWSSEAGKKLGMSSVVNNGFTTMYHKFIFLALEFYRDKRLAIAIRSVTAQNGGTTSAATLVSIRDTLSMIKKSFENFNYGRNYHNTLSGIVWAIAAMATVRDLRATIGVPPEYKQLHQFFSAAYDILILKRPITQTDSNRFEAHIECARNGRDILLDIEAVNFEDTSPNGDLETWLNIIESQVEGYRTAYRTLTGVDLGASANAVIEQQV
jgi:hypothetical protein